ncbi:NmrA family transcriptional regulator [Capnocytophaga sp. HP1101]
MKVVIFGATGGIGKWAVKHALAKGYEVTAYVRNPQKIQEKHERLEVVKGEILDEAAMTTALKGVDAVIWCVGISMKDSLVGDEELRGHEILLRAMRANGIKRLVDWATPSVKTQEDKRSVATVLPAFMAGILFPKGKKQLIAIGKLIQESHTDWTIVRFLAPKNSPYKGKVKVTFGERSIRFAISREDIAAFMVAQVENKKYIHRMPIIGS